MDWKMNKRDYIGIVCWLMMGVMLGSVSLLLMVAREVYQWKRYNLPKFEWEDIIRYGSVIAVGSIIHYWVMLLLLN